ncbi:eukaryotic translation intiation factor, putative [Eimeria necatrix]|uniref:Eukaryotic translation intiation factor, putative n=1 Tax=Eimeria necatrix TaxID=51315 RepID=U6N4S1_9EIME|nr:eukaryotic translation intiation factor, putative [Eimeria necatrix]CDJ68935.1 eukaryotic translation intiation factor, putative [Eimeria necatrix]
MIDKAVTEPDWSEMYADLCQLLQWRSVAPYGDPETIRKTAFMLSLLTRIQEEFEAMPSVLQPRVCGSAEEQQQEEARLKRRVMGVVKLIGELFHRKLLGFKVVNDVVVELVMRSEQPDEHLVECFLQLIATVGYFIDQNPKLKIVLDSWFGRLRELQSKSCYSKRIKCVIQDTIDMRRAEWRKKIHKERAKALDALHDQLETEEVLGGAVHAAQYGNIIVVGERTNLNGQYLDYLKEQENKYQERVKNRLAAAAARGSATMNK